MSGKQDKRARTDRAVRTDRAAQMRQQREAAQQRRSRLVAIGITVLVLVVVAGAALAISRASNGAADPPADVTAGDGPAPSGITPQGGVLYTQADAGGTPKAGSGGDPGQGEPVPVVVYEDFQCPVCGSFEASDGPYLEQQVAAGAITVEYRPIAILDGRYGTSYSRNTANAAACTLDDVGVMPWKRLHDTLYQTQLQEGTDGPTDPDLIRYALGSGAGNVATCIQDGTFDAWVGRVSAQAGTDDITGTPTVLVNGTVVEGEQAGTVPGVDQLTAAISAARG